MYQVKGLTIRNIHVKYESPNTYQSKVMTKVKVFEGRTDRQTDRQTDGQTDRVITIGHPP